MLEPSRRDSGPAVAVAAEIALRRAPDTVVAVFAADHVVENRVAFKALCRAAAEAAADFGITEAQLRRDLQLLWVCGLPGHTPGD